MRKQHKQDILLTLKSPVVWITISKGMFSCWTCWQHSEEFCSSQLFKDDSETVVSVSNISGLAGRTLTGYTCQTHQLTVQQWLSCKHRCETQLIDSFMSRVIDVEGSQICTSYSKRADGAAKALMGRSVPKTHKHSEPTNYQQRVFCGLSCSGNVIASLIIHS